MAKSIECEGCTDDISVEEQKAGSTNKLCISCEYIHPTQEERIERKERIIKERAEWRETMKRLFPERGVHSK